MNLKEKTVVINNKTYRYSKIVALENILGDYYFGIKNKSQHLYFLSTDKICEGDWILLNNHTITKCLKTTKNNSKHLTDWQKESSIIKIISSTDPSLNLPKPSDSFLQVYIDAYNKNEKIEECLVEYIDNGYEVDMEGTGGMDLGDTCWVEKIEPKVTKGEITIRKVKDSWSREEVIKLLNKFNAEHSDLYSDQMTIWISQNL